MEMNKKLNIYVSWENLRFEVPDPDDKKGDSKKVILNGLNGHVKPGQLVAVIGPSGSGKSSFLNCIGGRTVEGVTGKIRFNGIKRPTNFARFTGYVVQDDLYFETLTVRETLTFAADLKLPMSMNKELKKERVNTIIKELDLIKCENTQIGTIGKGISGGERRRLAIGLEIINEPSFLLLDEPTSGLDSASALMVGKILQKLCISKNITILCTIHQPRYALAKMFDKLYFLAKGNEIYFGPTIPYCLTFFEDAGYPCPPFDNPADFLLDLVNTALNKSTTTKEKNVEVRMDRLKSESMGVVGSNEDTDNEDNNDNVNANNKASAKSTGLSAVNENETKSDNDNDNDYDNDRIMYGEQGNSGAAAAAAAKYIITENRDEIINKLVLAYQKSEYRENALKFEMPSQDDGNIIFSQIASDFYITPWYNQFRVIFVRSFLHKFREPIALMTQVFNAFIIPLLFGSVYWQIDLTQSSIFDRIAGISLLVIMLAFFTFDIIMLFPLERNIFNRENASGMYTPSMFYFGRTFAEMPQHIILLAVLGTISYWMYGLQNDAEKFFIFLLIVELTGLAGAGLLLCFSAYAKNLEQSNLLATFFILLFMLFDGNWISLDKVPIYWQWVRYLSFMGIGSQAAVVNEYRGLEFICESDPCYHSGEDVLYVRGLDDIDVWDQIGLVFGLGIAFRFIAYMGVLFLFRTKSPMFILKEMLGIQKQNQQDNDN